MSLHDGERQVFNNFNEYRSDHKERYIWAADYILSKFGGSRSLSVLDAGCGTGYGTRYLKEKADELGIDQTSFLGIDYDIGSTSYANNLNSVGGSITYKWQNLDYISEYENYGPDDIFDFLIAFEVIEHLDNPVLLLDFARFNSKKVLLSVPNETAWNYRQTIAHHKRHYTISQIEDLVESRGFEIIEEHGQQSEQSAVGDLAKGSRTIVLVLEPRRAANAAPDELEENEFVNGNGAKQPLGVCMPLNDGIPATTDIQQVPIDLPFIDIEQPPYPDHLELQLPNVTESLAIVAMGPSSRSYMNYRCQFGGWSDIDQIWAINAMAGIIKHDLCIAMDDVSVQEERAENNKNSDINGLLKVLRSIPIFVSSRLDPGWNNIVRYPIEQVIGATGTAYYNSTAAWALGLAIARGYKIIYLFGLDFHHVDSVRAEAGRGCVEHLIGIAASRGIEIRVPGDTTLLDACLGPEHKMYGYDLQDVKISINENRSINVMVSQKEDYHIDVNEIERRYGTVAN